MKDNLWLWIAGGTMSDPMMEQARAEMKGAWARVYRHHTCLNDEARGIRCGPCLDLDTLMAACEELGHLKALRSLGAGTPEAVTALRALVKAAKKRGAIESFPEDPDDYEGEMYRASIACFEAIDAFATPTEKGQG